MENNVSSSLPIDGGIAGSASARDRARWQGR
jgi:hypothetical protein